MATVSDDTQMALFTFEALLRAQGGSRQDILNALEQAYLDCWATQQPQGEHRYVGDLGRHASMQALRTPGLTCLSALKARKRGATSQINDSKGCGAVMCVVPIGWFPQCLSSEEAFDLAAHNASISHGHPSAALAAGATALIVRELVV